MTEYPPYGIHILLCGGKAVLYRGEGHMGVGVKRRRWKAVDLANGLGKELFDGLGGRGRWRGHAPGAAQRLTDQRPRSVVGHHRVHVLAAQRHDPWRAQPEQLHAGARSVVRVHDVGPEAADRALERLLDAAFTLSLIHLRRCRRIERCNSPWLAETSNKTIKAED